MRINLISKHHKNTGSSQDVDIMRGLLTVLFEDNVQIQLVRYIQPQCDEADINIFIEAINPSLVPYAGKNIWIPNHSSTYRTWVPYMNMMNEIWVKTHEAERIFKELTPTHVRYIGWTSLNKEFTSNKNYNKAIVTLGNNIYREVTPVFHAYQTIRYTNAKLYKCLPLLNVVYNPRVFNVVVPSEILDKVTLHTNPLTESYDALLKECGLCICIATSDGFGHTVNECMSSGYNLILSSIAPFLEDVAGEANLGVEFVGIRNKVDNLNCFGTLVKSDVKSLCKILNNYCELSFSEHKTGSEFMRGVYETNHRNWMNRVHPLLVQALHTDSPYSLKGSLPDEQTLPNVSVVCVTRDRRIFMPIIKYSYMIQSYPEDKLELVVVDDGDDPIEDTLIGVPNVTYVRLDEKKTIGEKRNIGVSKAMYDVITFMDDDDVYPNNSVLERTAMMLMAPQKDCAFCTVIPCYDISKYCSFMNAPPVALTMSERISEATLVFTRKFWEERKFGDSQIAEGDAFIRGREHMCRELSPQEIIVSLVHPKNTSSRKIPEFKEPNGCHFGFNEKLFAMVSEIGEELKVSV